MEQPSIAGFCLSKRRTSMENTFDRSQYFLLKQTVEALAGVCDGALLRDDQGFDGTDTRAGHLYAFLPLDAWPLCAFHRTWHWTKKYHRQLEAMQLNCTNIQEPPLFEDEDRQIALAPPSGYYVIFPGNNWDLIETFRQLPGNALHRVPIGTKLFFRYRTYQGKASVLLAWASQNHFRLGPGVREQAQSDYRGVFEQESDSFALYFPDRSLNARVKTIPGYSHSYAGGFHWTIAADHVAALPLRAFL